MPNRASAFASIASVNQRHRNNVSTAARAGIPTPYKQLHDLLKEAGLRACLVEQNHTDNSWSVSAIHSGGDGNWLACQAMVHHHQLLEAFEDDEAHRKLVSHLAKTLAPCARNVT
jgi:hypothetical protein